MFNIWRLIDKFLDIASHIVISGHSAIHLYERPRGRRSRRTHRNSRLYVANLIFYIYYKLATVKCCREAIYSCLTCLGGRFSGFEDIRSPHLKHLTSSELSVLPHCFLFHALLCSYYANLVENSYNENIKIPTRCLSWFCANLVSTSC